MDDLLDAIDPDELDGWQAFYQVEHERSVHLIQHAIALLRNAQGCETEPDQLAYLRHLRDDEEEADTAEQIRHLRKG